VNRLWHALLVEDGWRFTANHLPEEWSDCAIAQVSTDESGEIDQFLTATATYCHGAFDVHTLLEITQKGLPVDQVQMWKPLDLPKAGWKVRLFLDRYDKTSRGTVCLKEASNA
jgi:hypothetical protein